MENYKIGGVSVDQVRLANETGRVSLMPNARRAEFAEQLDNSLKKLTRLKFSGHAIERLADRKFQFDGGTALRLENAVDIAEKKGSRDSLVLLDQLAFVVSVKNRTVVTALDTQALKEGVFTKIDSTIFG